LKKLAVVMQVKTVAERMADRRIDMDKLVETTGLDRRIVEAIVGGRYTPSPEQRRRLAAALGVGPEEIAWGHTAQVEHVYGHGPQFGRSP
jgi:plasmid maintenance system antidote protein VapI